MVRDTIEDRGVRNPDVLRAMRNVPRHLFVLPTYIDQAYDDHPLPIGYGQTISQPYVVAWMTELLDLKQGDKVLVFKYKKKKQYKRTRGHRQHFSEVRIEKISVTQ
jgi:protein-L-isoaspartate O-methyltransferase